MAASGVTYKAVVFDYGGVITMADIVEAIHEIEEIFGVPKYTVFKYGAKMEGEAESVGARMDKGSITFQECADIVNERVRKATGVQEFDFGRLLIERRDQFRPCPHVESIIQRLRKEGLKTAVLSNNWRISEKPDDSALFVDRTMFDVVVDSCQVGMRKPDPEIYQLTLDRLGTAPQETIFLDDLKNNIDGAEKMGIKSILVIPSKKSEAFEQVASLLKLDLSEEIKNLPN